MEKVTNNNLTIISKPHAHLHTMAKTHAKFKKSSVQNCKRSCAHKTPRVNVDGKTNGDGWMDGQTDGNLRAQVAHAKAGAKKNRLRWPPS